jgi:hypothetical protein
VVLCDGSLACLVALAIEAERADSAPLVIAGDPGGCVGPGDVDAARAAVETQARLYDAALVQGGFLRGGPTGADQSRALLAAAHVAAAAGKRRLVWGVQYAFVGSEPDLDLVASTVDRCLLVSRLASLDLCRDAAGAAPEVRIDTPLVDLCDEQVADLALDMRVPWRTAWWIAGGGERARVERARWEPACTISGPAGSSAVA